MKIPAGQLFWTMRETLWPERQRAAPLVRMNDDDVDRVLEQALAMAGISSATFAAAGCRGLADHPPMESMEPVFEKTYAPYRELRRVWIPFAACAAQFYESNQARQPSVRPLVDLLKAMRHQAESAKQQGDNTVHTAWHGSPLRTLDADPVGLLNEINALFDDLSAGAQSSLEAMERLERRMQTYSEMKRTVNIDVSVNVFIDVMSIAYFRFSKHLPSGNKIVRDFVKGAWWLAYERDMGRKGERIFRGLSERVPILSSRINDLGSILEFTEAAWHDIIHHGPFDEEARRTLKGAIYDAYMSVPRTRFWPDLPESGEPSPQD